LDLVDSSTVIAELFERLFSSEPTAGEAEEQAVEMSAAINADINRLVFFPFFCICHTSRFIMYLTVFL
jgi:hypothetical protein